MKLRRYTPILSTVALTVFLASCSSTSKDKQTQLAELVEKQVNITKQIADLKAELAKETPDSLATVRSKEVVVAELTPKSIDHYIKTQGLVESEENISVSAKSMGVIAQVLVREGELVNKGQTLAQIDNTLI